MCISKPRLNLSSQHTHKVEKHCYSLLRTQRAEAQKGLYFGPNKESAIGKAGTQGSRILTSFCIKSSFFIPWLLYLVQFPSGKKKKKKNRHRPYLCKAQAIIIMKLERSGPSLNRRVTALPCSPPKRTKREETKNSSNQNNQSDG